MVDKLKPAVREAVAIFDKALHSYAPDHHRIREHIDPSAWSYIRAELLRLAEVELSRCAERIEALAEANRQRERAERAESALAELRAKVKSAPVGVYAATAADHGVVHTHRWIAGDLIGKRVRLLLDDGEGA